MDESFNPFSLSGKTLLITGASSGIGRAVAILCSRMGAAVILSARNVKALQSTMDALSGDGHCLIQADLTDDRELNNLVEQLPALDGVAHCAGTCKRMLCKDVSYSDIDSMMRVNFNAAVLLQSRLLSAKKIKKSASIVFVSSRTADVPTIANSIYSASKGALKSYARCLALELAPRRIRVNCISPAMVWTNLILDDGITVEQLKEKEREYPLGRYGRPEDVANLAAFLLSDASSWMTGSCVDITGGSIEI